MIRKIGRMERHGRESTATDSVNFYFKSIKKYPLLTSREEKHLARKIAGGDPAARRRMIESNLRLVVNIAKRYMNRGFLLQDLIEEGNIGLIKSVERFRPAKGCRFSTYATYWIRQSIERAMANQSDVVRLPIHITSDIYKVARAVRALTMTLNRDPDVREIAEKTGLSGRYVKKLDIISKKSYSLEAFLPDGGDQSLLDRLEDMNSPNPVEIIAMGRKREKINRWLMLLDETESLIIKMRFGLDGEAPKTLEEAGSMFGVTRERARQIEAKALNKLKKITRDMKIASLDAV